MPSTAASAYAVWYSTVLIYERRMNLCVGYFVSPAGIETTDRRPGVTLVMRIETPPYLSKSDCDFSILLVDMLT